MQNMEVLFRVLGHTATRLFVSTMVIATTQASLAYSGSGSGYGYGYGYGSYGTMGSGVVVLPSNIEVGDQVYDASVAGLRLYLNGLHAASPAAFARLDPALKKLENQRVAAVAALVTGCAAGTAALLYALTYDDDLEGKNDIGHSNFMKGDTMKTKLTWTLVGLSLGSVGALAYLALAPGRRDLMSFINTHNQLHDGPPMKLQLGWMDAPRPLGTSRARKLPMVSLSGVWR